MVDRLPVARVLSGSLPSLSGLLSTCFKYNAKDAERVSYVKAWYEYIQTSQSASA